MNKALYYLALPYQGTQEEQNDRLALSLKAAVTFLQQGLHLFAPLTYVNPIADALVFASIEEQRKLIMAYLLDFLERSQGMVLLTANGWQSSWGVGEELRFCRDNEIPVYLLAPEDLSGNLSSFLETPLSAEQLDALLKEKDVFH